ncbi:MAG: hypothetical protein H8E56_03025 [Candidatus Marinimicrobia bacterium]|nr:hypothetical protein [Candidatus Neomarinimicrobiota bacterium]
MTSNNVFLDTNILIYAFDQADKRKQELAKANRRLRHKGSTGVYNVISGGEQDGMLVVINRMESMADLAPQTPSIRDRWVKVYGEEVFEQAVKDWYDSYTKSESEILRLLPEMTTPSNN